VVWVFGTGLQSSEGADSVVEKEERGSTVVFVIVVRSCDRSTSEVSNVVLRDGWVMVD